MNTHPNHHPPIPTPSEPHARGSLPDALTFFLTQDQRRQILTHLNTKAPNRTTALLQALALSDPNRSQTPSRSSPPSTPSR